MLASRASRCRLPNVLLTTSVMHVNILKKLKLKFQSICPLKYLYITIRRWNLRLLIIVFQPKILAKIMWDKLAECTASTIDQFFTWKQTFFGPNPTFPPSPHAMLFVRKGLRTSPTLHRGEGGSERTLQQFG